MSENQESVNADLSELLKQLSQSQERIEELSKEIKNNNRRPRTSKKGKEKSDRVLARHYHSHQMNDGVVVDEAEDIDEDTYVVYCSYCHHTNPLTASVFVNLGPLNGLHWVCREHAKDYRLEEYFVK